MPQFDNYQGVLDDVKRYGRGQNEPDRTVPVFRVIAAHNPHKSAEQGRPVYDDVEMVEIHIPGDRNSVAWERVQEHHKLRWPRQYEEFKAGKVAATSGTPLAQWPGLSMSQIAEMAALHIRSVEDLAGLTDNRLDRLGPGGRTLRERARVYLAAAAGEAPMAKLVTENQQLRDQLVGLTEQIGEMKSLIDGLRATATRPAAAEPDDEADDGESDLPRATAARLGAALAAADRRDAPRRGRPPGRKASA